MVGPRARDKPRGAPAPARSAEQRAVCGTLRAPRAPEGRHTLRAMPSAEGNLTWFDAADRPDLVAPAVSRALPLVPRAKVAEIDATLADTAAFCSAYDVAPEASANC